MDCYKIRKEINTLLDGLNIIYQLFSTFESFFAVDNNLFDNRYPNNLLQYIRIEDISDDYLFIIYIFNSININTLKNIFDKIKDIKNIIGINFNYKDKYFKYELPDNIQILDISFSQFCSKINIKSNNIKALSIVGCNKYIGINKLHSLRLLNNFGPIKCKHINIPKNINIISIYNWYSSYRFRIIKSTYYHNDNSFMSIIYLNSL